MANARQPPPLVLWENQTAVAAAAALSSQTPPLLGYMYHNGGQRFLSRPPLTGVTFDGITPYTFSNATNTMSMMTTRHIKEQKPCMSPRNSPVPVISTATPMSLDTPPRSVRLCPQQNHYQQNHYQNHHNGQRAQQREQSQHEQQRYQQQQREIQDQQQQQETHELQVREQERQSQMQQTGLEHFQQLEHQEQKSEQHIQQQEQPLDDEQQKSNPLRQVQEQQQNITNTISLPGLIMQPDGVPIETPKKVTARRVWSHTETKYFLNTMNRYYQSIQAACTNNQKGELWDRVVEEHNRNYPERSKRSCQQQWERLFCRYKATKQRNGQPGVTPVLFEYNDEIKLIVEDENHHQSNGNSYEEKTATYFSRASSTSSSSSTITNYDQPTSMMPDHVPPESTPIDRVPMPSIGFESSFFSLDSATTSPPIAESSQHGINPNGTIALKRAAAEAILNMDERTSSSTGGSGTGMDKRRKKNSRTHVEKLLELLEKQHREEQERKKEERERWEEYQRRSDEFRQEIVEAFNSFIQVLKEIHSDMKKE